MADSKVETFVTDQPIDLTLPIRKLREDEHGAENIFIGYVRQWNMGRKVRSVEYDCFVPLCEKSLLEIGQEALQKFETAARILIVHRFGLLQVGEASVLVAASTRHRDEAYRITRFVIEEIKVRSPIWKKETYVDGESEWVRGHALCQHRKVDHHEHGGHCSGGR